jgi:hypothetical protein
MKQLEKMKREKCAMAKMIIVLISSLLFFSPGIAYSDSSTDLENISFDAPDLDGVYTLSGAFNKIGIVEPNGTIFKFHYAHKNFPLDVFYSKIYIFLGRTGEKTFELQYKPEGLITEQKTLHLTGEREYPAKINLFFTENDLYPLKIYFPKPCSKEDKVYLKMLKLQGNEFQYQIILPECLKKLIKTETNK